MKKAQRLTKNKQFQHVRTHGRSWSEPLLVLGAAPNDVATTRFGFAVGKRVGKAVTRNRVKRLLREAARHASPQLASGWDIVLIARPSIVGRSLAEIEQALENLVRRGRLRASPPEPTNQRPTRDAAQVVQEP